MKIKLFILVALIFLALSVQAIQEPLIYYKLNLDYSYGDLSVNSTEIEFSNDEIKNIFGLYSFVILDFNGEILNLTFFDVPNEILYDTVDENGEINGGGFLELNQTNFDIYVPYYSNAKEIIIYDENLNELTKKDISEFSKERPEIVKEVEGEEREIPERETLTDKISQYWWILLIILVILIILLFQSLKKKK